MRPFTVVVADAEPLLSSWLAYRLGLGFCVLPATTGDAALGLVGEGCDLLVVGDGLPVGERGALLHRPESRVVLVGDGAGAPPGARVAAVVPSLAGDEVVQVIRALAGARGA